MPLLLWFAEIKDSPGVSKRGCCFALRGCGQLRIRDGKRSHIVSYGTVINRVVEIRWHGKHRTGKLPWNFLINIVRIRIVLSHIVAIDHVNIRVFSRPHSQMLHIPRGIIRSGSTTVPTLNPDRCPCRSPASGSTFQNNPRLQFVRPSLKVSKSHSQNPAALEIHLYPMCRQTCHCHRAQRCCRCCQRQVRAPAIQIAPSFPFGVKFSTLFCASVVAS